MYDLHTLYVSDIYDNIVIYLMTYMSYVRPSPISN